jgi:hypothetical protein
MQNAVTIGFVIKLVVLRMGIEMFSRKFGERLQHREDLGDRSNVVLFHVFFAFRRKFDKRTGGGKLYAHSLGQFLPNSFDCRQQASDGGVAQPAEVSFGSLSDYGLIILDVGNDRISFSHHSCEVFW